MFRLKPTIERKAVNRWLDEIKKSKKSKESPKTRGNSKRGRLLFLKYCFKLKERTSVARIVRVFIQTTGNDVNAYPLNKHHRAPGTNRKPDTKRITIA